MKIGIGTYYTVCCCQDADIIKDEETFLELLEDMKDDDPPFYDFYETAEELVKKCCSCEGECTELSRLKKLC